LPNTNNDYNQKRWFEDALKGELALELTAAKKSEACMAVVNKALEDAGHTKAVQAKEYRQQIVAWMMYWPFCLSYQITVNLGIRCVKRLRQWWNMVYEYFAQRFQAKSNRMFAEYERKRLEEEAAEAAEAARLNPVTQVTAAAPENREQS
jgi:hypothetical protein